MSTTSPLRDASVVVVNLARRFAGVSATILALVPVQQRTRSIAAFDRGGLGLANTISFGDLLRHGWWPPKGGSRRVWHARRSLGMALGLLLKHVLRQPWKLVYTSPTPRRHGWVWRSFVNRADAVVAVTERAASFLDWHTVVVPHGVDTEAFRPPGNKLEAWREGELPGKYGIGVFGRIRRGKGTDLFVDAMCEVLPRHPDFTAVIAGFCKAGDQPFKADLERRIQDAGLERRIVFLGDLAFADIKRWYQRVSLCVAPSRTEGFGLTPLEAMASGAAAVTSREGHFPHMIVPGTSGDIVDTGDADALARAIEELIADPEELLGLGARAREYVVDQHSIEREAAGLDAVYDELLGSATDARESGD
jgi:mannosyltransferase